MGYWRQHHDQNHEPGRRGTVFTPRHRRHISCDVTLTRDFRRGTKSKLSQEIGYYQNIELTFYIFEKKHNGPPGQNLPVWTILIMKMPRLLPANGILHVQFT